VLRNSADHEKAETSGWLTSQLYAPSRREPVVSIVPAPRPSHAAPAPVKASTPPPIAPRASELPVDGILVIRGNQKVIEPVGIRAIDSAGARPADAGLVKPAEPPPVHPADAAETTLGDSR
jgi:hypothetical protein